MSRPGSKHHHPNVHQLVVILDKLKEVVEVLEPVDGQKMHRFKRGWDDQRIADELGWPQFVRSVGNRRREIYGLTRRWTKAPEPKVQLPAVVTGYHVLEQEVRTLKVDIEMAHNQIEWLTYHLKDHLARIGDKEVLKNMEVR
jgi:hypothetical protein